MSLERLIVPEAPSFISSINADRVNKLNEIKSKRPNAPIRIATDFEGPLVLGDTAADIMRLVVKPENANGIDYGDILFNETYDWYMNYARKEKGTWTCQEGTDINFTLPLLLQRGVTEKHLDQLALNTFKKTPGTDNLLKFLEKKGAHIVAITTAWQEQHDKIGEELGLDGVIGTAYPIDKATEHLKESGAFHSEMKIVSEYLTDVFHFIYEMNNGGRELAREKLHERIEEFYVKQLGVAFSRRERVERGKPRTVTAEIIEGLAVIGDRAKARTALNLFRDVAENVATVAVGDGLNDQIMLDKSPFSIGLNGPKAVLGAKMGVVTEDVSVLSEVYEVLMEEPEISVKDWVEESQKRVGNRAFVHKGGLEIPEEVLQLHSDMRKALRGKILI